MWSSYHAIRTSKEYRAIWASLLNHLSLGTSPIFCQYVGNQVFKELITRHYPLRTSLNSPEQPNPLTEEEMYGLRYAAGYIPRSLKKKLPKSTHPLKNDLQLCIFDLLDEGDESEHESKNWVHLINRGGLTRVNNPTYEVFVSMEYEFRSHLNTFVVPDFEAVTTAILENEDVLFFWSIVSCDWEEASAAALLMMIVKELVKIRGYSLASAWVEKYKAAQKQSTQKSKGLRKQLISKPQSTSKTLSGIPHEQSNPEDSDSD